MADISTTLTLDDRQFQAGINKALQSTENFSAKFSAQTAKLNDSLSRLAGLFAGVAVGKFIADMGAASLELKKFGDATGFGVSAVVNIQKAFKELGGTSDNANDAITDFVKNVGDAAVNGGELLTAFNKVGVTLKDIQTLSEKDLFAKTIEGVKNLGTPAERSAAAMKIFGESVKGIDLLGVSSDVTKFTAENIKHTQAVLEVAKAQKAVNQLISDFQKSVLLILGPIAETINGLDQMSGFSKMLADILVDVIALLTGLLILKTVGDLFKYAAGAAALFGTSLKRMIPYVGGAIVAFEALDAATKWVTDSSIGEWAGKAAEALGLKSDASKEDAAAMADEKNEAAELADQIQRKVEFLDKEKRSLNELVTAYQKGNAEQIKRIQLDTELIGKGEEYKARRQAIADLDKKNIEEVAALRKKYDEATDITLKNEYAAAIDRVNEAYRNQKKDLEAALSSQAAAQRADNLRVFTSNKLFETQQRLKDIQSEIAQVTMSDMQRAYADIENSARRSAEEAIRTEEVRRGSLMTDQEKIKYYKAATQEIIPLLAKTNELVEAERARRQTLAFDAEKITQAKELQAILDDTAKLTMTTMQKKEYDITRAAEERAKEMIRAEEAARGVKLSVEEQAKYYEKAREGVKGLTAATQENYDQSRSWSTGWQQAFNDYAENATNAANVAKNIFSKAMKGMEDLLVDFVKTGEFNWKNFVNMMLEELLRAQIQSVFAKMFSGMNGAMSGTSTGGSGSLLGNALTSLGGLATSAWDSFAGLFADGGNIPAGKWGIAGEAGPEIINGPATVTPVGNVPTGNTIVNYNISAVDAMSFKQMIARDPSFIHAVASQGAKTAPVRR